MWVSPIYILTLLRGTHLGQNVKFLLTLIYKNDFWVQRVAKDEGSRVLINPTALFGGCEISRNARFSETLQSKNLYAALIRPDSGDL